MWMNTHSILKSGMGNSTRAAEDVREEVRPLGSGSASHFDGLMLPMFPPIAPPFVSRAECHTPFREALQSLVMSIIGVICGTFPDTYGVFYMTVDCWCTRGPSRHRHGERHRGKDLGKRFSRYRDGHDAHDGDLRAYSRQGVHLYFVDYLTPST